MEIKVGKTVLNIGDKEKDLLRATASEGPEAIQHRQAFVQSITAAWKAGVLEPDTLDGIFARVPVGPGSNSAKFPLDFYAPSKEGWFKAFLMPREGALPEQKIEGNEIDVPVNKYGNSINWSLEYARDARWDIVARALEVFINGFTRKLNDDGWKVIMASANANAVQSDSAASAGVFTRRLMLNMMAAIRRLTGGRNSKLTDIYLSPEGVNDLRALTALSIDDLTLRSLIINPENVIPTLYGVRLHEMEDFGESQEYETLLDSTFKATHGESDVEFCVGLDLQNRDAFVMPVKEDLKVFDDSDRLHHNGTAGVYGWMYAGFGALDNRRALLGSF